MKNQKKKIESLTPEQESARPVWKKEVSETFFRTSPPSLDLGMAKDICCDVVCHFYPKGTQLPKRFYVYPSLDQCWKAVCLLVRNQLPENGNIGGYTKEHELAFQWPYLLGQWDIQSYYYYGFCQTVLGIKLPDKLKYAMATIYTGPIFMMIDQGSCIVCDFPVKIESPLSGEYEFSNEQQEICNNYHVATFADGTQMTVTWSPKERLYILKSHGVETKTFFGEK